MAKGSRPKKRWILTDNRLFTLDVSLIGGPVTGDFARKNPVVSRTIQMRGDQTLEELHYAIYEAFDREEEHMYEFQVGGKKPMDRKARCYVMPMAMDDFFAEDEPAGDVTRAVIGSMGLRVRQVFYYWFDFGDDWWHRIQVVRIEDEAPQRKYPVVAKRVGESPPQYPDWDESDEDQGE